MRMSRLEPISLEGLEGKDKLAAELANQDRAMKLQDFQRRIRQGKGRLVSVTYTQTTLDADSGEEVYSEASADYYVGRLDPGQSGKMVALLAALAIDGKNLQETFQRKDALVFLEILDTKFMTAFLSIILHEGPDFVEDNWDFAGWVIDVVGACFEYNDFFGLIKKAGALVSRWGVTGEQAKALVMEGKLPQQAPGNTSDSTNGGLTKPSTL